MTCHSVKRIQLTSFVSLNFFLLQFLPAPVCQLIRERCHQQDFGYGSREGLIESDLLGSGCQP
jgi:hypothetical protein